MTGTFPKFGYNPVTGEWNDSLKGDYCWSNVNVSEAVPDVMTPSTWSLWWIYHYEASPFEFPGDHPFCGNICGRPYLNLSLISSLYRAIGKDVREELQGDMIGSAPAELDIPVIPFSPLVVLWKVLPGMLKAQQNASRDRKSVAGFLTEIPSWCRTMHAQIQNVSDASGLFAMWAQSIRPAIVRACRMLRSVTMTLADPATKLRLDLTALVGEADANILLSNLSGASGDLESLGPLAGLAKVKDGRMSREQYMKRYGHRGPHEMELSVPDNDDDPAWLRWAGFILGVATVIFWTWTQVTLDRQWSAQLTKRHHLITTGPYKNSPSALFVHVWLGYRACLADCELDLRWHRSAYDRRIDMARSEGGTDDARSLWR